MGARGLWVLGVVGGLTGFLDGGGWLGTGEMGGGGRAGCAIPTSQNRDMGHPGPWRELGW